MIDRIQVSYHNNAGVSVEIEDMLFIFNYWEGQGQNIPPESKISLDKLQKYSKVFVFVCNAREDIYDPIIYQWRKHGNIHYIVSSDVELQPNTQMIKAHQTLSPDPRVVVSSYPSTDKGVALLVNVDEDIRIFNAGTLNLWHWMESSSMDEVQAAQAEYENVLNSLPKEPPLISFFPLDARQGLHFEVGAVQYISQLKPRFFVPVRFLDRADIVGNFAREHSSIHCVVLPFLRAGTYCKLRREDGGFVASNIHVMQSENP